MTTVPPKFSETELQNILAGETIIPRQVPESFIATELMNNSQLTWTLNPFLLKANLLKLFIDTKAFQQWRLLKSLNWVLVGLIVVYAFSIQDFQILWTVLIYIALINSGILDLWISVSTIVVLVSYGLINKVYTHYFWFTILTAMVAYTLSKLTIKTVERTLINYATADIKHFGNFFQKKLFL